MLDTLSIDQLRTFIAVAEAGSFSRAAREQNRATSAVTYAIDKIEASLELKLFDRSKYRPALTATGQTLLSRARRVTEELDALCMVARGIASGIEAEVAIAVDSMFPMELLVAPLGEFHRTFPTVQLRIVGETLGSSSRLVADGKCDIGLVGEFFALESGLICVPVFELHLVMVAAPSHPLATIKGAIGAEALREHVQLILADRTQSDLRDFSVFSGKSWRLSDLGAKRGMLLAGLGFGSLPLHLAKDDIAAGRLVALELATPFGRGVRLPMVLARRNDSALGPATTWLVDHLRASARDGDDDAPQ